MHVFKYDIIYTPFYSSHYISLADFYPTCDTLHFQHSKFLFNTLGNQIISHLCYCIVISTFCCNYEVKLKQNVALHLKIITVNDKS